ncbi:pyridoxal-phosphate dependent enzyme [Candidatus Microgenomates bacterium]|nr:pyridoxal-phosphate dependent enzyme [Candidatus Microgenomates bacterium]
MAKNKGKNNYVPRYWFNIVPFITNVLKLNIPEELDPKSKRPMALSKLAETLPTELARQELNSGIYGYQEKIPIPKKLQELYCTYRETPLVRARKLEKYLKLKNTQVYFKREDKSPIHSYKLNSSYVQAYYAKKEGVKTFVGDTGPGNWGMGMAMACKIFKLKAVIYMEKRNYLAKIDKVKVMEKLGAKVIPIETKEGTIAASISEAIKLVNEHPKNKLSLGCLTAYSALHNTVIGVELAGQLKAKNIHPDAFVGVVGGGSSFSGFVFPLIKEYIGKADFIAVESASVPSFTKGRYRYENPDLIRLMPRIKMFTLGNRFVPKNLGASGLNYHGKNPLLSLLVKKGIVKAVSYTHNEVDPIQDLFDKLEGIRPAAESCYAIIGAMKKAQELEKKATKDDKKTVIFSLTGNAEKINLDKL